MLAFILESAGFGEWFVLLAVVLIVVGPKQLPSTARKLGQYYNKFRRAAESFKRQLLDMDTEFDRFARQASQATEDAFNLDDAATAGVPAESGTSPDMPRAEASAPDVSEAEAAPCHEQALEPDRKEDV